MQFINEVFTLNAGDKLFIHQFQRGEILVHSYLKTIDLNDFPFIFRIAENNAAFKAACRAKEFNRLWQDLYCASPVWLDKDFEYFHPHHEGSHFDLLSGFYLFVKSREAKRQASSTTDLENYFLSKAADCFSIHAFQKQMKSILCQCRENSIPVADQQALLLDSISRCKMFLPYYGSYAYLMLADIYFAYAQTFLKQGNLEKMYTILESIKRCADLASQYLGVSFASIFNSSLGRGLKKSNSFEIEHPEEIKSKLTDWCMSVHLSI